MASDDREQKLLAFLAGQLALANHRTCVRIELEYKPASGYRAESVRKWEPDSDPEIFGIFPEEPDGPSPDKLAQRKLLFVQKLVQSIISLAEDFADSYGAGNHLFCVRATEHLGNRATHLFKVQPGYNGAEQGLTEQNDPTSQGIVKQLMGHLENKERGMRDMMGQFLVTMKHGIEVLRDENESLRAQLAQVSDQRSKMLDAIEEARSKEHDREIELAIVMGERERKDFAVKKIVNLLPVAMSAAMRKLAPGKSEQASAANGKPVKVSPLAASMQKLAGSLTEDQKAKIQEALAIDQAIALQEIIEGALEGGNLMLPELVNNLVNSLRPPQIQALIQGVFTQDQAMIFIQAMQIAKAATSQTDTSTAPASASRQSQDDDDEQEQGASA